MRALAAAFIKSAMKQNDCFESPASPPDEPKSLVPSLLSIAKSTRAFVALRLAEIDLHPGQDQLLDRLEANAPVSVSVLADKLSVRPSTVSKMLDRLIEKDLVRRVASDRDLRRTMIILTEAGQEAQNRVREIWNRLETDLENAMDPSHVKELCKALGEIDQILGQRLRRLR